ncbi:MAG TPA: tetratricopeptide repeat protein [Opitutus sp.]|nr:tetratricopeptide repeat protein [Opitutus sp.]
MKPRPVISAWLMSTLAALPAFGWGHDAPKLDPNRIINESYSFKRNAEPEMTEEEYALYEKIVNMISVQPELALKLLQTMIGGDQKQSPAFEFVLGNVYYSNNHADLAEQHYRKAIAAYPAFTRAWSNLGALLYGQGRYEEAGKCLTKTIESGDRDAHTLGLLAYCLEKTGQKTAAEMDYIQALGLDPGNTDYLEGLVGLYYDGKQFDRAEELLKQLVRLKPNDRQNWLLYANVLKSQDRPLEAIGVLEAANGLGLLDTDGLLVLGDLYQKARFYREATVTFAELRKKSVKISAECLLACAESLTSTGKLAAAEDALNAIDFEVPPEERVRLHLARAELRSARHDDAGEKQQLDDALELDPLNGKTLLALGRYYKAHDDVARADLALETAARQQEVGYRACVELADLAVKTRRYARALDYLERAEGLEKSIPLQQYIAKVRLVIGQNENNPATQ